MDANTIIAVASCVQAAVLVLAAAVAMIQVREARRLREEQAQPYVVVSLETEPSSPFILNLVIKNLGHTAARNVVIDFDPPLVSSLDHDDTNRVTDWTVLTKGIPTLVPGQSMITFIDSLFSRYTDDSLAKFPNHVTAKVSYMGDHGRQDIYDYEYDLDFSIFYGSHWIGQKSFNDLVKAVEELSKAVGRWTTNGDGVKVYAKDFDQAAEVRQAVWHERGLAQKMEEIRRESSGPKQNAEPTSSNPEQTTR